VEEAQSTCEIDHVKTKRWRLDGKLHRVDGPAVEWSDGDTAWYIHGQLHREDGPAIKWIDDFESWWFNGKRHRENGPAVVHADGSEEWWLYGEKFSSEHEMVKAKQLILLKS